MRGGEKVASHRPSGLQAASEHMFVSVISWPSSHTGSQCAFPSDSATARRANMLMWSLSEDERGAAAATWWMDA